VITRRHFGALAGGALASIALGGACHSQGETQQPDDGRLAARPRSNIATSANGENSLGLAHERDAILRMPARSTGSPIPLLVLLHGAGGSRQGVLKRLGSAPDEQDVAVLAPDSRDSTWDAIRNKFGPDVAFLNRALERVFETVSVDPERIAIGGFSDGATYALSLGLINGDLFSRVVAFSPGFVIERTLQGKPRFFVSHGVEDPILPIDRCSRRIVSDLRKQGYDVTFREFEGGHSVPADIARDGIQWVAAQ
jgi:phospholipase/carboxylesterase